MSCKPITLDDVDFLAALCGAGRVVPGRAALAAFGQGVAGIEPPRFEVRVAVGCTAEVAQIMKYAFDRGIAVVPDGRQPEWGQAPQGGIVLDLSAMNRILELDRQAMALTVEPAALLAEIAGFVEGQECFYPVDPALQATTLAAPIDHNGAAGPGATTREFVLGLEVVLANGEILELGGKDPLHSSGQGLKDLVIGSGGSLGIVTRATLRLTPLPRKALSLLVPFRDLDTAMAATARMVQPRTLPTAMEYLFRDALLAGAEPLEPGLHDRLAQVYLLLSFDADSHRPLERIRENVTRLCLEAGALNVLLCASERRREEIWRARGAFEAAIRTSLIQDPVALGA